MSIARTLAVGLVSAAIFLPVDSAQAQPDTDRADRRGDRNATDRDSIDRNGDRQNKGNRNARRGGPGRLPAEGSQLPELSIFDDAGNEFSTEVLREHYTVIVFGCLT